MRLHSTVTTRRRTRGVLAAALGLLLVAGAAILPATAAQAMTQVGPVQSGVPGGTVQATVQNQGGGNGTWTITAPQGTTITAAQSVPGTGLGQFSCVPTNGGQQASCGTSLWGARNQVIITMAIAPTAALGTVAGSSQIAGIAADAPAPYSITVVAPAAPAAPTITAPPAGDESIETQPTITGTKAAGDASTTGTTLTATIDGDPLCTVQPSTDTAWSCTPATALAVGQHTVEATQTDRFGQVSPAATSTFTVLAPAGLTVQQPGAVEILAGLPTTRTVTVGNDGDGEARGVTLSLDTTGLDVTSCTLDGDAVDCAGVALGTIAPGASRSLRVVVTAPAGTAPGSEFPLVAQAASTTASVSPVSQTTTLRTVRPTAPVITAPTERQTLTERRPTVRGTDVQPGAVVRVTHDGATACTATADAAGRWSCRLTTALDLGSATLVARAEFGGASSDPTGVRIRVVEPTAPGAGPGAGTGTGGTTPAPGTGSGPSTGPAAPGGGAASGSGQSGGGPVAGGSGGSGGAGAGAGAGAGSTAGSDGAGSSGTGSSAPAEGSSDSGNGGSGGSAATNDGALAMDLRFGTQRIMPGTAADMRGTLGPNASGATVAITFAGRMTTGMVYRDVAVEVDDRALDCSVATTSFSCMIPLDPGEQADVDVRVFADAVNAPDTAVQQLQVTSNRASQANAITVTTAVAKGATEASELADQITTFNVTEFPGAMVPLLAMLLFALAATVAGRRSGGAAAPTPTGPAPTGPAPTPAAPGPSASTPTTPSGPAAGATTRSGPAAGATTRSAPVTGATTRSGPAAGATTSSAGSDAAGTTRASSPDPTDPGSTP